MAPVEKLDVSRVAIIGAGASGLAAAKYLLAEKKFSQIQVFEQRATPGGIWNYNAVANEPGFTIPRVKPSSLPDQAVWPVGQTDVDFITPVYDQLETNVPASTMSFTDKPFPEGTILFPRHSVILEYLKSYAEELKPYTAYQTQVLNVEKPDPRGPWQVETVNLQTKKTSKADFDAVLIASGHYNDPYVPDIPGLAAFDTAHPGVISHSKFYRRPDGFKNKKVVVVGNWASGVDISYQLSSVARLPVIISEKEKSDGGIALLSTGPWSEHVLEIAEFLPQQRGVRFIDGRVETDIDAVIFCTGYHYAFPFLQHLQPPLAVADGTYTDHLWENLIYTADATLAIFNIPQRGIPFPIAESQSAVVSRIWSGRLAVPARQEREAWLKREQQRKGEGKAILIFEQSEDTDYINRLYALAATATKVPGLENNGEGKRPPYWGPREKWAREKVLEAKLASRALGDGRFKTRTLEDLGFNFDDASQKSAADGGVIKAKI